MIITHPHLQVDIEGEELGALEQASKSLVDGVDQILLEVHMHISEHAHDSAKPEHFEQVFGGFLFCAFFEDFNS